jgi:hypothetical protein
MVAPGAISGSGVLAFTVVTLDAGTPARAATAAASTSRRPSAAASAIAAYDATTYARDVPVMASAATATTMR